MNCLSSSSHVPQCLHSFDRAVVYRSGSLSSSTLGTELPSLSSATSIPLATSGGSIFLTTSSLSHSGQSPCKLSWWTLFLVPAADPFPLLLQEGQCQIAGICFMAGWSRLTQSKWYVVSHPSHIRLFSSSALVPHCLQVQIRPRPHFAVRCGIVE